MTQTPVTFHPELIAQFPKVQEILAYLFNAPVGPLPENDDSFHEAIQALSVASQEHQMCRIDGIFAPQFYWRTKPIDEQQPADIIHLAFCFNKPPDACLCALYKYLALFLTLMALSFQERGQFNVASIGTKSSSNTIQ